MKNLKVKITILYIITLLVAIISIFGYFNAAKKSRTQGEKINSLADTIRYVNGLNQYYLELLKFDITSSNFSFKNKLIKAYDITADTNKSTAVNINSLFEKNKYTLILRYTQIGCDECSSLTVKKIEELRKMHPDLPVYAFVDFTNYDSYLQWRKVGEIDFPVFYVKKGAIDFDKDCTDYSYVFLVNKDGIASDFFIPNSGIPNILEYYFNNIYKKEN